MVMSAQTIQKVYALALMGQMPYVSITIIGSGIAGLFAALKIANSGHEVLNHNKIKSERLFNKLGTGRHCWRLEIKTDASGIESPIKDTLISGDGLCDEKLSDNRH